MDTEITIEEKKEKIEHFTQQLINSGYGWSTIREVVISSLRSTIKKEKRRIELGEKRYRTGEESMETRIRNKLLEVTEWYKRDGERENDDDEENKEKTPKYFKNRSWVKNKRFKKKMISMEEIKARKEKNKYPEIRGVLFVPHTEKSELAKRIRGKLKVLEEISSLRVKVVERTGEKVVELLHKSNPWEDEDCKREKCKFCDKEETRGKCKQRGVVYENECLLCKEGGKEEKESERESWRGISTIVEEEEKPDKEEKTGKKRSREEVKSNRDDENLKKKKVVKYIGETSRSGYERLCEHWRDFENLSEKSHILKHYLNCHRDKNIKEMKMSVKIVKSYRSSFERQIGESVMINHNLRENVQLLNSKNEYNRCSIPRLTIAPTRDEIMEEILEEQEEKKLKREILKLKQKLRSTGEEPKSKKRRLIDVCDQMLRENYMTWYIRRKEEERKRIEEEKRDREREERLERAQKKKR